jgi:anti-sigma regulatory factor (Ser/Thr protein kinase)
MTATFQIARRDRGEELPPEDARRVAAMRRLTAARLDYCRLPHMTDSVTLIVSELVTNAIQHSGGVQVTLAMRLQDGYLHIVVSSDAPGKPVVQNADDDAEHGRGLKLVEWCTIAYNGTWGTSDAGATVWCLLPVGGASQ